MLLAIEKDKAKTYLDNYFKMLSITGYIKKPVVVNYLSWLFLADFVERVYSLLTNEDYNKINNALMCIFGKSCLLPYESLKENVTFGQPIYMGEFKLRITEDNKWRESEDSRYRITED